MSLKACRSGGDIEADKFVRSRAGMGRGRNEMEWTPTSARGRSQSGCAGEFVTAHFERQWFPCLRRRVLESRMVSSRHTVGIETMNAPTSVSTDSEWGEVPVSVACRWEWRVG